MLDSTEEAEVMQFYVTYFTVHIHINSFRTRLRQTMEEAILNIFNINPDILNNCSTQFDGLKKEQSG